MTDRGSSLRAVAVPIVAVAMATGLRHALRDGRRAGGRPSLALLYRRQRRWYGRRHARIEAVKARAARPPGSEFLAEFTAALARQQWPAHTGGKAVRIGGWLLVVAGIVTPLVRKQLRLPAAAVVALTLPGPAGLAVAMPRSRLRDVAIYGLHMWGYIAFAHLPSDDEERQMERVHWDYPVEIDRAIGIGTPPSVRLQRWLHEPETVGPHDKFLAWTHWLWFLEPHLSTLHILLWHPKRWERSATRMLALFDLGALFYALVPTAPPWLASRENRMAPIERIIEPVGEEFWGRAWQPMYDFLGGNAVAAMPSMHFSASVMAAHNLQEVGTLPGIFGWGYAATLGFALVYLGEHYVVDLIAGAALAEFVRLAGPLATPVMRRGAIALSALEHYAGTEPPRTLYRVAGYPRRRRLLWAR